MANEVELKKESNVIPFDASLLLEDAGSAGENMTADDMLIPRLRILQSGSFLSFMAVFEGTLALIKS